MKNIINKVIAGITVTSMLTWYAGPVFAYLNEETVYSNLDTTGKSYQSTVTTVVEDKNGTKTTQDTTKEELPIETKITYYLDGKEIDADKIAGQKGRVTIKLEFENNEKNIVKINGKDQEMYTPFVVVSGLMIDNKKNTDIEIKNGKLLTNGNSCIAVGMAFPGMQESLGIDENTIKLPNSIEISMNTDSFESGNIMVYSSPKLLGELDISMSDFDEIFDQINALETASKALENGAFTLADGMKTLDVGAVKLDSGIASLDSGIDTLKAGSIDLNAGAVNLKNGASEFAKNSQAFNSGVSQISSGVSDLNTQYSALNDGINTLNSKSSQLQVGASELKNGVSSLNTGVNSLKDGATALNAGVGEVLTGINTVVDGLAPKMTDEAKTANQASLTAMGSVLALDGNYANFNSTMDLATAQATLAVLQNQLNELEVAYSNGLSSLTDEQKIQNLESQATINKQILTIVSTINYSTVSQAKNTLSETASSTDTLYNGLLQVQAGMQSVSAGANSLSLGLSDLSNGTNNLLLGANQLSDGTVALTSGTANLADGSAKVVNGLATLNAGATSLADNSNKLTAASTTISNGAASLQSGTASLQAGVIALSDGAKELKNGSLSLTEGTLALVTGSQELSNGIKQFNEEGISKIVDLANNDGKDLIKRVEKLEQLSKDYVSFASEEKRDDLKFIAITDSVKVNTITSKSDKNSKDKK